MTKDREIEILYKYCENYEYTIDVYRKENGELRDKIRELEARLAESEFNNEKLANRYNNLIEDINKILNEYRNKKWLH